MTDSQRARCIEAEILVTHAPIVREILETSQQQGGDVVAMASHGRTGVARVFYRSVAAGVLHSTGRLLLLVTIEEA